MLYLVNNVNNVFIRGNIIHETDKLGGFNDSKDKVFSNFNQATSSVGYWEEWLQLKPALFTPISCGAINEIHTYN